MTDTVSKVKNGMLLTMGISLISSGIALMEQPEHHLHALMLMGFGIVLILIREWEKKEHLDDD